MFVFLLLLLSFLLVGTAFTVEHAFSHRQPGIAFLLEPEFWCFLQHSMQPQTQALCLRIPIHYMLLVDFPSLKNFADVVSVEYRIEIHLGEQFSLRLNTLHPSSPILVLLRESKWED